MAPIGTGSEISVPAFQSIGARFGIIGCGFKSADARSQSIGAGSESVGGDSAPDPSTSAPDPSPSLPALDSSGCESGCGKGWYHRGSRSGLGPVTTRPAPALVRYLATFAAVGPLGRPVLSAACVCWPAVTTDGHGAAAGNRRPRRSWAGLAGLLRPALATLDGRGRYGQRAAAAWPPPLSTGGVGGIDS